ncbi:coat protein F [Ammoniphilus oxalaticus]|uniref:Coat protein F n=1 Tax=Ammoniphilus oxalaticus TaxID=66863 RepID=A0A419SEU5_9BACL|nr:spore coat protein [Ammoniphilus oxalaticus]RKD21838.1 coat protein F [Ammoniphilus oxalaticus]
MAAQFGAHELMEMHEVLTDTINGINLFQLYRPHVKDQQLAQMMDNHLQFMISEYNGMVQALNQRGMGQAVPYQAPKNFTPSYGLNNPPTQMPNTSANQMDDRDVSSGMLGCYKASTICKTMAALECADSGLRRMMQQGATNCSEMAYEVWQYMHQQGYYQVPTMKDITTHTVIDSYGQAQMGQMSNMPRMTPMQNMQGTQHLQQSPLIRTYM